MRILYLNSAIHLPLVEVGVFLRENDKQYCEWLGTNELDLKTFDVDKMNLALKDSITELIDFYEGD